MSEFTLREARPEDRPALIAFMAALQDFERSQEANRRPGAAMADGHLAALEAWVAEDPANGVIVAESGGAMAGFILFGIDEALANTCRTRPGGSAISPSCGSSLVRADWASLRP